jgi:hypothetical protein
MPFLLEMGGGGANINGTVAIKNTIAIWIVFMALVLDGN